MRKNHTAAFKAKIVVEALRETKTLAQIAAENQIHPTLVTKWKAEALEGLTAHFERGAAKEEKTEAQEKKIAELYQEIGRLTTQVNWLKKNPSCRRFRDGVD
jgi:transposase-like protein